MRQILNCSLGTLGFSFAMPNLIGNDDLAKTAIIQWFFIEAF